MVLLPVSVWGFDITTLQNFEQDVKNNIAVAADPYFPDSTLDAFINLGCRDVASRGALIAAETVIVTTNQWIITLPTDAIDVEAVFPCSTFTSRGFDRISFRDWGKIAAMNQLTTAKYYVFLPATYDVENTATGHRAAKLWLYPASSVAVDTIIVIYYQEGRTLSSDADTTNIPYMYRQLVVFYATAMAYSFAQDYDKASWWFSLYDQWCNKYGLIPKKPITDYYILPKEITK